MNTKINISGDNRGIVAGRDIQDANLINVGDVEGSYNAIGVGAQVIINHIRQARSVIEELSAEIRLAEAQLADAVADKIYKLTQAIEKSTTTNRRNPYRSLLDYRLEDAPYFYGRDMAIRDLLGKIHDHRLTILHADSGSGKSSLLQAGLMSRLLAAGHLPLRLRPYKQEPTFFIKKTFLADVETLPELERFQRMSLVGYLQAVTSYLGRSTLYLFLDQFEEFFAELPRTKQEIFAQELADCLEDTGLDVRWVLSIRKEFFSNLSLFQPRIEPFVNQYFMPTFNLEEAKSVIIQPAYHRSVTYENGLVETIITDLCDEDGSLQPPQVQLVCYALFETILQSSPADCITAQLYNQPRGRGGAGARGILSSHLSRELERMSATQSTIARQILEGLITSQTRRSRRRYNDLLDEIRQRNQQTDVQQVDRVLADLVSSRLLRTDEAEDDHPLYELAHDYLLTVIEIDPETLARKAAQEFLNQEVVAWQADPRLRIGEEKLRIIEEREKELRINTGAAILLQLSREAIGRRQRTVTYSYRAAAVALIAALLAGIIAIIFSWQANDAQDQVVVAHGTATAVAIKQEMAEATATAISQEINTLHSQANSIRLANNASALLDEAPELAVLLSTYALSHEVYTQEAESALRQSLLRYYTLATITHGASLPNIAYGIDSKTIFSGDDEQMRAWTIATGELTSEWKKIAPYSLKTVVSPVGEYVATALHNSGAAAIQLFNPTTGESQSLGGHTESVLALAFSSDGQLLASGDIGGQGKVWNVATGTTIFTLSVSSRINGITIQPNNIGLATAEDNGILSVWNLATNRFVFSNTTGSPIYSIAYNPDGTKLATAHRDLSIKLWDATTAGRPLTSVKGHTNDVRAVAFSPNGKRLLSAGLEGTAILWDVSDITAGIKQIRRYAQHHGPIFDAAYAPDGTTVATSDTEKVLRIWTTPTHDDLITDLIFDPAASTRLLTVSFDRMARLWRYESGYRTLLFTLEHPNIVRRGTFSPDGRWIATACDDGQIRIWDAQNGELLKVVPSNTGPIGGIAFSKDGEWFVSAGWEGVAHVWDTTSWAEISTLQENNSTEASGMNDIAINPHNQEIATVSEDGMLRFWTTDGELTDKFILPEQPAERVKFSNDGFHLAVAAGKTVMLLDALAHTPVYTMTQHTDRVFSLAFDPTGQILASSGYDGKVILLDLRTHLTPKTLWAFNGGIFGIAFNGDGRSIAAAGADGDVYLQALQWQDLVTQAQSYLKLGGRWWREAECQEYLGISTCPIQPMAGQDME